MTQVTTKTMYQCPRCWGTGSIDSDDSGDESWWDCTTCKGTGKLADRRRNDTHIKALREIAKLEKVASADELVNLAGRTAREALEKLNENS